MNYVKNRIVYKIIIEEKVIEVVNITDELRIYEKDCLPGILKLQ